MVDVFNFTAPARVFVVGDIHGCNEELNILLSKLTDEEHLTADDRVVFLGDYIDRGPDSKGVIDTLIQFKNKFPDTIFLRGNHEDILLCSLKLKSNTLGYGSQAHMSNGGIGFYKSYGVDVNIPSTIYTFLNAIPAAHIEFIKDTKLIAECESGVFVHAGIQPNIPLEYQTEETILWVREYWIQSEVSIGKTVYYGHTPGNSISYDLPYKVCLDSGCVFGKYLSCLEITENKEITVKAAKRYY